MVEFRLPIEPPKKGKEYYRRFFYRVGDTLFVGTVNRTHATIANEDGNLLAMEQLLRRGSLDVDTGSLNINVQELSVVAFGDSNTLRVQPEVREEVRRRTGILLARKFETSYSIEARVWSIEPLIVYSRSGKKPK
jgi:hypothetical protein